jgi:hypothetical protein
MRRRKILDTPKVIQQCLNCPKDKCDNCIGKGHDSSIDREPHKTQIRLCVGVKK